MKKEEARKRNLAIWQRLWKRLDECSKILLFDCTNVSSTSINEIRQSIRPFGADLLVAKNTLLKAGIRRKMQKPKRSDEDHEVRRHSYRPMPQLKTLLELCNGNVGLIFCKDKIEEMKSKLNGMKSFKQASIGLVAPYDIVIQPESICPLNNQRYLFDKLGIAHKRKYDAICVMEEKKLISKGKKITKDQCLFMRLIKAPPFAYELKFTHFYDDGTICNPSMLDLGKPKIIQKLRECANRLTAAAVSAHYPTPWSVKYFALSGFWNLFSFTLATDYNFERTLLIKEALVKVAQEKERIRRMQEDEEKEGLAGFEQLFAEDSADDS